MEASPGSALYNVSSATPPFPTYQVVVKAPLFPPVIELTSSYHNWEQFLQPEIRSTDQILDCGLERASRYLCQRTCWATKYFSNPGVVFVIYRETIMWMYIVIVECERCYLFRRGIIDTNTRIQRVIKPDTPGIINCDA